MSALGQKQTCAVHTPMSALHPIADMCAAMWDVRFVPIADTPRADRTNGNIRIGWGSPTYLLPPYCAPGINLRAERRVQPVQVDGQAPGPEHSQRCRRAHLAPKDVRPDRMRVR